MIYSIFWLSLTKSNIFQIIFYICKYLSLLNMFYLIFLVQISAVKELSHFHAFPESLKMATRMCLCQNILLF